MRAGNRPARHETDPRTATGHHGKQAGGHLALGGSGRTGTQLQPADALGPRRRQGAQRGGQGPVEIAGIQRCQIHKKRNVKAHLPEKHWPELLRQLNAAYYETDLQTALKGLKTTARWLDRISPDAAASLREGMKETLTVTRLGVPELLSKTLATTNPIESAFDVAQKVTRRVKCWRKGDMRQR